MRCTVNDTVSSTVSSTVNNIVIITSVLNCINEPLSYYHIRSVLNTEDRFKQSLVSINSIKKYIPNVDILYCECSDLSNNKDYENEIISNVDYYYNFYDNINIQNDVNSALKGLGEISILLEAINKLVDIKKEYTNIFKLSGRYYLNNNFDYSIFNNNNNVVTYWDNSSLAYCTIFYKININDIYLFKSALIKSIPDVKKLNSIEQSIYKYFQKDIQIVDKLNISGILATEGYLFNI